MSANICCYNPNGDPDKMCNNPCLWEIHNLDDKGPENDTYSCDEHLSDMLWVNNTVHFIGPVGQEPSPI